MLADEQDPVVVVEDDDARRRGSRSGRRRRSRRCRRAGSTSSCQTVIQAFSYATRRVWRRHGPIGRLVVGRAARRIARHRRTAPARARPSAADRPYPRPMEPTPTRRRDAARPASQPVHAVAAAPRRPDPGVATGSSCRRTCGCRSRWPTAPDRALPGDPRDDPVPQGRLARGERREPRRVAGGARLRVLPARRPGHGHRRPGSPSTSTPPARRRTATTRSSGWRPSRGRNGKVGMWGISYGGFTAIQVAHAPAAAPRGDRPDDGDRRPLHRRRPLPRRLRDGVGAEPVRGQHGRDERAAAAAGVPRRRAGPTSGASGSSGRRSGSSSGSASSTTGRTGGRARSPPTTTRSTTPTFLDRRLDGRVRRRRRCGCWSAARTRRAGR